MGTKSHISKNNLKLSEKGFNLPPQGSGTFIQLWMKKGSRVFFSSLFFLNPGNNLFNLLEIQYAGFLLYLVIHSFLKVL